jgi:hypothetical protein
MTGRTLRRAVKIEGGLIAAVVVCAVAALVVGGPFNVLGPLLLLCALLGAPVVAGVLVARIVTERRQRRAYEQEWGPR